MDANKKICAQFKLDDEEIKVLEEANGIIRKVKEFFYVNTMNKWCDEIKIALKIISNFKMM